jgi:hypothetical protein
MKAFKEITEWATDFAMPNHVYFLSDSKDKMYGYVKSSTGEIQEMGTPYRFKVSGRKFKEVDNTWDFKVEKDEVVEGFVKIVIGSMGEKYTITEVAGVLQCSCPGSKFRGKCRHIES